MSFSTRSTVFSEQRNTGRCFMLVSLLWLWKEPLGLSKLIKEKEVDGIGKEIQARLTYFKRFLSSLGAFIIGILSAGNPQSVGLQTCNGNKNFGLYSEIFRFPYFQSLLKWITIWWPHIDAFFLGQEWEEPRRCQGGMVTAWHCWHGQWFSVKGWHLASRKKTL